MKPAQIKELLDQLDPDKEVWCQVVAKDNSAFYATLEVEFTDTGLNVITMSHPQLRSLKACIDSQGLYVGLPSG